MKNSDNKINYFTHRNKTILSDKRLMLGEREIVTLLTVMDMDDTSTSLDGMSVLDLGCGDQFLRNAVERRGGNYIGLDIGDLNFEKDDFPINDNSIDIAISLSVIEHLYDPGIFLGQIKKVLKTSGVLWLETPDIKACKTDFWNDPTHVHPYTKSSLEMVLKMNGLNVILTSPNYRCKSRPHYEDKQVNFLRARYLMPFRGTSSLPLPNFFKGGCTGLFVLASRNSVSI